MPRYQKRLVDGFSAPFHHSQQLPAGFIRRHPVPAEPPLVAVDGQRNPRLFLRGNPQQLKQPRCKPPEEVRQIPPLLLHLQPEEVFRKVCALPAAAGQAQLLPHPWGDGPPVQLHAGPGRFQQAIGALAQHPFDVLCLPQGSGVIPGIQVGGDILLLELNVQVGVLHLPAAVLVVLVVQVQLPVQGSIVILIRLAFGVVGPGGGAHLDRQYLKGQKRRQQVHGVFHPRRAGGYVHQYPVVGEFIVQAGQNLPVFLQKEIKHLDVLQLGPLLYADFRGKMFALRQKADGGAVPVVAAVVTGNLCGKV